MKIGIVILVYFTLIYLGFAFSLWEIDPSKWNIEARVGCVFAWILMLIQIAKKTFELEK